MRSARPLALVLLIVVACGGNPDARVTSAAVRDSAGIEIVENTQPGWSAADGWRLSDAPTLRMGAEEGDSAHEFFSVTGAARLADGTIVVANSGTSELRFFAADGTPGVRVGGKGGGPGEFQALMSLVKLSGDSLMAYDAMNRRLSIYDPTGRHIRDVSFAAQGAFVLFQFAGRFDDGTYLAHAPTVSIGLEMLSRPAGPARDSLLVMRLDSAARVIDTLGVFPAGRVVVKTLEMMGRSLPAPVPVPFSPTTVVAAGADVAYVGTTDTYEIRVYSRDGGLRRLIRRAVTPRTVTDADKQAHAAQMRDLRAPGGNAMMNSMMARFREAMADVEYPTVLPAYSRLQVDPDGNLWVAAYHPPGAERPEWAVFTAQGRLLGTVTMPPEFSVREIGRDYVLGQTHDDAEIEQVVLYHLIKPTT